MEKVININSFIRTKGLKEVNFIAPSGSVYSNSITKLIDKLDEGESIFFWDHEWKLKTSVRATIDTLSRRSMKKFEIKKFISSGTLLTGYTVTFLFSYNSK